jgi:hypothetical protein
MPRRPGVGSFLVLLAATMLVIAGVTLALLYLDGATNTVRS